MRKYFSTERRPDRLHELLEDIRLLIGKADKGIADVPLQVPKVSGSSPDSANSSRTYRAKAAMRRTPS
jgi:hypothetical protein